MRIALFLLVTLSVSLPVAAQAQSTPEATPAAAICAAVTEGTPEAAGSASADPAQLEFDLIFLEAMIPHHRTSIDLAAIVRERSERSEVVEFAEQLIALRELELSAMETWRREWYPGIPTVAPAVLVDAMTRYLAESPGVGGVAGLEEMGAEHDAEAIADVCEADEIDLAFIDALIARNSASLILAQKGADLTTRREIRELALSLVDSQQFEIDQALAWREEWYPDAPPPVHDEG